MFSATITVGDEENLYVDSKMPLRAWKNFIESGAI
jgi:hypothetical protein